MEPDYVDAVSTHMLLAHAYDMSSTPLSKDQAYVSLVRHVYDNCQVRISTDDDYNVVCNLSLHTALIIAHPHREDDQ